MSLQVEVALIADPADPFGQGMLDERWYALPYAQRRRVTLQVQEDDTLASVLERAAEALGLQPPSDHWAGPAVSGRYRKVAFYKPADDDGFQERPQGRILLSEMVVVDAAGHAILGVHDKTTVRYSDLLRTEQAGALDGDPLKPYLILDDGWGDAPPVDWATVGQGLDLTWEMLKTVGSAYGAGHALNSVRRWLTERVGGGRDALAANPDWAQRGYRPDQFGTLLEISGGDSARLAVLLDCSEDEAQAILWVMGFAYDEQTQLWKREGDETAVVLGRTVQAIAWASHAHFDNWQPPLRRWLLDYLESGEPPALETLDPPIADDDTFIEPRPTLGERIDGLVERLRGRS